MPLYDYRCDQCGKEFEGVKNIKDRNDMPCPQCGGYTQLLITTRGKDWFKPHVNEDFDGTPIEVRSKGHLKELCKKHGVYSRSL